jgi:hypothetical protein
VKELLGYVFSPLREGDIALYRGSGNGLAPILLAAAEETSLGCVEQLKREFALKAELDADWAARPVALTHIPAQSKGRAGGAARPKLSRSRDDQRRREIIEISTA